MQKKVPYKKVTISKDDIQIDCNHSEDLASLSIETKDQKGLFAYIAKIFDDFGIEIQSAKIHTHKNRVKDLLLLEKNGNFCNNTNLIIKELTE